MTTLTKIVTDLIMAGADPNDLQKEFEEAVSATVDWELFPNGSWDKCPVCSKCGSLYPSICSDDLRVGILDFRNPAFHKNQPGVHEIPHKEYLSTILQVEDV